MLGSKQQEEVVLHHSTACIHVANLQTKQQQVAMQYHIYRGQAMSVQPATDVWNNIFKY